MSDILFLSHRIPFPPDRGDKIRSHHVLKRLARLAPVHIATFADDDHDMSEEVELAVLARSYKLIRRTKPLVLAGMQALATGKPVSLTAFHDPQLAEYIEWALATYPISSIYVFSGQMGQYIPESFTGRVVVDFVDVDSAKFDAYATKRSVLMRWINSREARLLRHEESRVAKRASASLLISDAEAELFRSRLPDGLREAVRVVTLKNGIDSGYFDPAEVSAQQDISAFPYPRLIFTGQMDYRPNIDAALRVMDSILPAVREKFPDASFHIVGRNPPPQLLARNKVGGCHVWGRVPDIRTWLKGADAALVPLDIARGVQNKVLEAMAMSLPVILTSGAATGIDAVDGQHFIIADSDADLAQSTIDLLSDPRRGRIVGLAARRFVSEEVSWQAALAPLAKLPGWAARILKNAA
jgi:sugar transferase (PEP-CTERM/EpsH1 system associated)